MRSFVGVHPGYLIGAPTLPLTYEMGGQGNRGIPFCQIRHGGLNVGQEETKPQDDL